MGRISGILGFLTQIIFTQILMVELDLKTIPISLKNSRILVSKIDFLTFAWAEPEVGSGM